MTTAMGDDQATSSSENVHADNGIVVLREIFSASQIDFSSKAKFRATKMWNEILFTFCKDMPVKKHRRQLKSFDNTFTGSEAVECLLRQLADRNDFHGENRTISRLNAVALLSKFYLQNVFEVARPTEKSGFRDDSTLYKFVKTSPLLSPPGHNIGALQRRATFTEPRIQTRPVKCRAPVTPIKYRKLDNSPVPVWLKPIARREVELPSKSPLNRRLSSSHGALPTLKDEHLNLMNQPQQSASQQTLLVNADSTETLVEFDDKENVEGDELRESADTDRSNVRSLTEVRLITRMLSSKEVSDVWKSVLTARLKSLLKIDCLDSFVRCSFEGKDVQWNCKQIGKSGIVRQNDDGKDEPPRWVLTAMRCLTRWPFENHVITLPVTYPGFERDVFTNVCHYFAQELSPLLTEEVALGMLGLIRWCQLLDVGQTAHSDEMVYSASSSLQRSKKSVHSPAFSSEGSDNDRPDFASPLMRIETEFSGFEPVTRFVQSTQKTSLTDRRSVSSADASTSKCAFTRGSRTRGSCALPTVRGSPFHEFEDQREHVQLIDETSHSVRRRVTFNDDYDIEPSPSREAMDAALQNLPGLVMSPVLMRRIEQARMRSSLATPSFQMDTPGSRWSMASSCCFMTPSKGSNPVGILADLTKEGRERCLSAINLVLTTLTPRRRRRLHYLVRFMHKVTLNHCLKLDPVHNRENRYTVLEALSSCIVEASDKLPVSHALQLVTVLLDNEVELFKPSEELKSDVQSKITDVQRERPVFGPQTSSQVKMQFCAPIASTEYEKQKINQDEQLENLLDQIASDENSSTSDRRKKLKQFKKTYPHIYARRFPDDIEPKRKSGTGIGLAKRLKLLRF